MHGHRFADAAFGAGFGRGRGGRGRGADPTPPVERAEVAGWFAGRLPDGWFTGPVDLTIDRDEITVVGSLAEPPTGEGDAAAARAGRISRFREETRQQRMSIADAAQERYGRSVAWGAACGEDRELFTTLSVPVMTRLRSRSEALVWAVRLVGQHADEWLTELRAAMASVEEVRGRGPSVG